MRKYSDHCDFNGPSQNEKNIESLLMSFYEAQKIFNDPIIRNAIRKIAGQDTELADMIQVQADLRVKSVIANA